LQAASKRVASQEAQVRLAAAQYVTASAEEKQAETQVQQAKLQLSYTKIFAPFDGRVRPLSNPGRTLPISS
jgi:multidrug resistance efflux pump